MENGHLLAVGDSITAGHTDSMVRVPGLGFGQWVADSLEFSYTRYARGGYTSAQIVAELLPKAQAHYDIALMSIGTNDVIQGLPLDALFENVDKALGHLASHAGKVAVLSVPQSSEASANIQAAAARHGAVMVDATLHTARLMSSDGIHPTALGQLELADRVAAALGVQPASSRAHAGGQLPLSPGYYIRHLMDRQYHLARRTAKRVIRR